MFKKILFFILLVTAAHPGQTKSSFDIQNNSLKKISGNDASITLQNELETTLLPGGYFTLGTNKGNSQLVSDDKCQITYGHPYALTSYSLISVDGKWYKADELFNTISEMNTSKTGDTLKLICKNENVNFEFRIINETGGKVKFHQTIRNVDTTAHIISNGFVLDPAIGKWGDGSLIFNNLPVSNDTILNQVSSALTVWEKQTGAKGIGFNITADESYTLIAGNWKSLYKNNSPELTYGSLRKIYDLLLKMYFAETEIAAGAEKTSIIELTLSEPDFSSEIFTRWDLPNYLDLTDGLMFPRTFDTYAELTNTTGVSINCDIAPAISANLVSSSEQYASLVSSVIFQKIPLSSSISYEDKIVEAILRINVNNELVDELHRFIFIPETPVSDTGLTVNIDTIKTSSLPKLEFIFNVKNNQSGYPISDLTKENVFLYENQKRINNFSMSPDTSAGVNATDIVFALDVTGSMGGTIEKVKSNIVEFSDSLKARGIDYRLGLVTFLDEIENVYNFTTDVNVFQQWIADQYAHGGGDGPENSLAALKRAAEFQYRTNCKRIVIWITDIDYHENDWATQLTKNEVVDLLLLNDITVHSIGSEWYKSSAYDPIILPTNGKYYDIYGNFRDILLDISRMRASGKYVISYNSDSDLASNAVKIDIRYAGRGGSAEFNYNKEGQRTDKPHLAFYPNPFNPEITFIVNNTNYTKANISIFNILGECVKTFNISNEGLSRLNWNATNNQALPVSTGFYIVQLLLSNEKNEVHKETAKILYMK